MSGRISESKITRMAGNIAAGLASKPDVNGAGLNGADGLREYMKSISMLSVGLARLIAAEVQRTAPKEGQ